MSQLFARSGAPVLPQHKSGGTAPGALRPLRSLVRAHFQQNSNKGAPVKAVIRDPAQRLQTSQHTSSDLGPSTSTSSSCDLGWRQGVHEHYVKSKCLGVGSFGQVYLAVSVANGKPFAVKQLPKSRPKLTRAKVCEKLARECDVMERLSSVDRVVQLEDCFEDDDSVYLVTEACSGGDLQKFSDTYGPLTERCLALVAVEILHIIDACHRLGVVHGDVKPANFCLVDEHRHPYCASDAALQRKPWLKAIDFGCSQIHFGVPRLSKRSGTPVYMAPEIFKRDYSYETDVWSMGVLLYQLFSRRFPFWEGDAYTRALSLDEVAKAISEAEIRFDFGPWLTMSPEGMGFIRACLTRDPAKRITVEKALKHPWLKKALASGASSTHAAGVDGPAAAAVSGHVVRSPLQPSAVAPAPANSVACRRDAPVAA